MRENRNSIMQTVQPGQSYELKGDDYSIKIAPMGQKEEGSTSIDFGECENRLREYYNLSANSTLSVFQTELTSSNNKSLTNKLQYVVYLVDDENSTQLNLSVCENQKVQINYALKNDTNLSKRVCGAKCDTTEKAKLTTNNGITTQVKTCNITLDKMATAG
mgnify:CR=1 FL=1